jgi:hypothetical protein
MSKPEQILLFADWMPNPSGGYTVTPKKVVAQEIGTRQAAALLGVCRSTMWELRNDPVAGKILKWRFTTPAQRKVKFTIESVLAYLNYTRTLEGR